MGDRRPAHRRQLRELRGADEHLGGGQVHGARVRPVADPDGPGVLQLHAGLRDLPGARGEAGGSLRTAPGAFGGRSVVGCGDAPHRPASRSPGSQRSGRLRDARGAAVPARRGRGRDLPGGRAHRRQLDARLPAGDLDRDPHWRPFVGFRPDTTRGLLVDGQLRMAPVVLRRLPARVRDGHSLAPLRDGLSQATPPRQAG